MGSRLNRGLIKLAATHRGARNLVQVSPAHVEPLKIIKVQQLHIGAITGRADRYLTHDQATPSLPSWPTYNQAHR